MYFKYIVILKYLIGGKKYWQFVGNKFVNTDISSWSLKVEIFSKIKISEKIVQEIYAKKVNY